MKKLMILSLVAAAGLTVAACKSEAPVENATPVAEGEVLNGTLADNMVAGAENAVAGATNTVANATNAM